MHIELARRQYSGNEHQVVRGIAIDISKNTQTLILTIFSGAIATYEDS